MEDNANLENQTSNNENTQENQKTSQENQKTSQDNQKDNEQSSENNFDYQKEIEKIKSQLGEKDKYWQSKFDKVNTEKTKLQEQLLSEQELKEVREKERQEEIRQKEKERLEAIQSKELEVRKREISLAAYEALGEYNLDKKYIEFIKGSDIEETKKKAKQLSEAIGGDIDTNIQQKTNEIFKNAGENVEQSASGDDFITEEQWDSMSQAEQLKNVEKMNKSFPLWGKK